MIRAHPTEFGLEFGFVISKTTLYNRKIIIATAEDSGSSADSGLKSIGGITNNNNNIQYKETN